MNPTVTILKRNTAPRRPMVTASRPGVALPAQLMQYDTVGLSSPGDAAAMQWMPAGAAQRTSYPAGSFTFRTAAQAFRTRPSINQTAFVQRLAEAVASIMPAGVRVNASITQASQGDPVDPSGVGGVDAEGPTWWVTVVGSVNSSIPWSLTGTGGLNRAIARAIHNSMSMANTVMPTGGLTAAFAAPYRPADGSQLQNVLDNPEACGSYQNTRQMWMRACTTVTQSSAAPQPTPPSVPPPAPLPTAPPPSNTPPVPQPASTCMVSIASRAWIRPTATFARVGPEVPAGTQLALLGRTASTSGSLRLYRVRVASGPNAGTEGFAALDVGDEATAAPVGCLTGVAPSSAMATVSTGGGGGGSSAPPAPPPPPPSTATPNVAASLQGGAGSTSSFPWGTMALTAGAVLVVGAAVINRDKIGKALSEGKARARTSYASAKDRYQSWRSK